MRMAVVCDSVRHVHVTHDGWDLGICVSTRSHNALLIELLFTSTYYQTLVSVLNKYN